MATTRIMPLHVGKGRTESRAISDIIDYVVNPKKTDNGRLITGYACDSRTADAEFLLAKRQYIAATGRVRGTDDVIMNVRFVYVGANHKGVIAFSKTLCKFYAQPVCFFRGNLTGAEGLAHMIGNHIIRTAHSSGSNDILPFC